MKQKPKYTARELAEAHIIPAGGTIAERNKADKEFSAFRRSRLAAMTIEEQLYSGLLQIKYEMENYIYSDSYNNAFTFGHFLEEYIHVLRKGKTDFSNEISLNNTKLSRLLHGPDEPTEEVLMRLEIHSNNTIPAVTWYRICQKQREWNLFHSTNLHQTQKKYVKARVKI